MPPVPEDPSVHIDFLYQCLAGDKKPIGLLLGAGCPVAIRVCTADRKDQEPLVPAVAQLTRMVADRLRDSDAQKASFELIVQHLGQDQNATTTVEDMLTHIRSLAAVAGNDEVRGLTADQLSSLDDYICDVIHEVVDRRLPARDTPYHSFARWVNAVRRDFPVEVFTPNYDLLLEQAMEEMRTPYFDGFPGVRSPLFDPGSVDDDRLPAHWVRIWKLHGSINWYQSADGEVFRSSTSEDGQRRVIHPSHLKHEESRRMPYLAMLDRLRNFLKVPTAALVLCGYSFRDGHINDALAQGLQYTRTSIAYALLFGKVQEYPQAGELARRHPNLNVLACDGGIVGGRELEWSWAVDRSGPELSSAPVSWITSEGEPTNGRQLGLCRLGDFAVFAAFLGSLFGGVQSLEDGARVGS